MGGSGGMGMAISGAPTKQVRDLYGPRVRKSVRHKLQADKKAMKSFKNRGGK